MKLLIGFPQIEFIEELSSLSKEIDVVLMGEDIQKFNGNSYRAIFISDSIFKENVPWEWVPYLKESFSTSKIYIVLSELHDALYTELIVRIAAELDMQIIPPGLTKVEIKEYIQTKVFGLSLKKKYKKGKIITVMSASSKDGATTIAVNSALSLASKTELNIALYDMNLKTPDVKEYLNLKNDKGFSMIQHDCAAGTLDSSTLFHACHRYKFNHLHILLGLYRREWAEKVRIEEIQSLLEIARESHDVTFVDVSAIPDNAATIQCVKEADERWVVTQPLITSFQSSWHDWYNSVWKHVGLMKDDFNLVINRNDKAFFSVSAIESAMDLQAIGKIPNVPGGAGIRAVNFGEPLFLAKDECVQPFQKEINQLTTFLAKRLAIPVNDLDDLDMDPTPGFLSRLARAMGIFRNPKKVG